MLSPTLGGSAKRGHYSISLISKMDHKEEGGPGQKSQIMSDVIYFLIRGFLILFSNNTIRFGFVIFVLANYYLGSI